jgi:hypothetical protein
MAFGRCEQTTPLTCVSKADGNMVYQLYKEMAPTKRAVLLRRYTKHHAASFGILEIQTNGAIEYKSSVVFLRQTCCTIPCKRICCIRELCTDPSNPGIASCAVHELHTCRTNSYTSIGTVVFFRYTPHKPICDERLCSVADRFHRSLHRDLWLYWGGAYGRVAPCCTVRCGIIAI